MRCCRETRPGDISGQIFKLFFIIGPNRWAKVDMKTATPPGEHVFDNGIVDFAVLIKHFQQGQVVVVALGNCVGCFLPGQLNRQIDPGYRHAGLYPDSNTWLDFAAFGKMTKMIEN